MPVAEPVGRSIASGKKLLGISRAAGFPEPGPGDRLLGEQIVGLAAGMAAAEAVFGEDSGVQLVRVMGTANARLADPIVPAFPVHLEPAVRDAEPAGLCPARPYA